MMFLPSEGKPRRLYTILSIVLFTSIFVACAYLRYRYRRAMTLDVWDYEGDITLNSALSLNDRKKLTLQRPESLDCLAKDGTDDASSRSGEQSPHSSRSRDRNRNSRCLRVASSQFHESSLREEEKIPIAGFVHSPLAENTLIFLESGGKYDNLYGTWM